MKIKFNLGLQELRWPFVAFVLVAFGSGWVAADCTVDFEDQPDGSTVTSQYLSCGVLFDSVGTDPPPEVYDYSPFPPGKILHSFDWYAPLVVRFVQPGNAQQFDPVSYIEFDVSTSDGDLVSVQVYDANHTVIASYASQHGSPETVVIDVGAPVAAYIVVDDIGGTSYVVDNLTVLGKSPVFRDRFESADTWAWSGTVQ